MEKAKPDVKVKDNTSGGKEGDGIHDGPNVFYVGIDLGERFMRAVVLNGGAKRPA